LLLLLLSLEFASASRNAASSFLFSNPSKGLLRHQNVNEAPVTLNAYAHNQSTYITITPSQINFKQKYFLYINKQKRIN